MALTRFWKDWTQRYTSDAVYWYFPKGKAIHDISTVQKQLKVLKEFEGERWRESQSAYLDRLTRENLSSATAKDADDQGIPMSRMLAQVFGTVGFAWIDENEAVTLTPAGEAFIKAGDPADILATQSRRYQIPDPLAGGKSTQQIEIHPVPFYWRFCFKPPHSREKNIFCSVPRRRISATLRILSKVSRRGGS